MRILVADDHALVRDALRRAAVEALPDAMLIECDALDQAITATEREAPIDLALLDVRMPGMHGIEGVRTFRDAFPDTRVAVFSGYYTADDIVAALNYGAKGFIPKSLEIDQVFEAIRMIVSGHHYIPPDILGVVDGSHAEISGDHSPFEALVREHKLTQREQDVLRLLVDGCTNKEIALRMDVQEVTVKLHLSKIYRKLGIRNRAQAVRVVLEAGWAPQALN
jgi:DNA-binding NarL/FixJ family response regulator